MNENDISYLSSLALAFISNALHAAKSSRKETRDSLLALVAHFATNEQREEIQKSAASIRTREGSEPVEFYKYLKRTPYRSGLRFSRAQTELLANVEKKLLADKSEKLRSLLLRILEDNAGILEQRASQSLLHEKFAHIQDSLQLSVAEISYIKLLFLTSQSFEFADTASEIDLGRMRSENVSATFFAGLSMADYRACISKDGILRAGGLIVESSDDYHLSVSLERFLVNDGGNFTSTLFSTVSTDTNLTLDDYPYLSDRLLDVQALLQSAGPVNILMQGAAGTGKTEFAKVIGASLQLPVRFLSEGDGQNVSERRSALVAALRHLQEQPGILVVDEAEALLRCAEGNIFPGEASRLVNDKSWANHILSGSKLKMIWIVNYADGLDPSVKRRFDYLLEFKRFTPQQRLAIWVKCLNDGGISDLPTEHVSDIAHSYELPPSSISKTLQNLKRISSDVSGSTTKEKIEKLIENQVELLGLSQPQRNEVLDRNYCLDGVRTDFDPSVIVKAVTSFQRLREDESNYRTRVSIPNLTILLNGPPGTGKTEFAKYLSFVSKLRLVTKRASDLLSMWVGGTEKAINEVFRCVESENAILFFDECDSFLQRREKAIRSWEVTQVNELLTHMESFKGILLCATNAAESLDAASIRRFTYRVTFYSPGPTQARALFNNMLFPLLSSAPSESQWTKIGSIGALTAGDFRNVRSRLLLQQMATGTSLSLVDEVIEHLEQEIASKPSEGVTVRGFNGRKY
ncbi:MAG: AAA family ATPase [Oligoflexales bacterium]